MYEPKLIDVQCFCRGLNHACIKCNGSGLTKKIGCRTCNGTGFNGGVQKAGKCLDCRGNKYRDMDNGGLGDSTTELYYEKGR